MSDTNGREGPWIINVIAHEGDVYIKRSDIAGILLDMAAGEDEGARDRITRLIRNMLMATPIKDTP